MKRNIDIQPGLEIVHPGDTVSVTGKFSLNGLQEGEYDMVICTETGILYDVFSSVFREVIVMP